METSTVYYALSALLILIGLVGTVVPALPGLPLAFVGMLLTAWVGDFRIISGWTVGALAILTVVAVAIDFAAGLFGAKRVGASKFALLGAFLGTLAGLAFGVPGLIVGPFVGALAGEMINGAKLRQASKVGFGTWLGMAVGALAQLALAIAMLGIFIGAVLIR